MLKQSEDYRLSIDAHVVRQLGEELITDHEQALLELVKNSYDADSAWCNVKIDTHASCSLSDLLGDSASESLKDTVLKGRITIADDGCGMDENTIKQGWLTISLSPKRAFKAAGKKTTKYNRSPLGDKGLGRLSSMKLGSFLRITTFSRDKEEGLCVVLSWDDCRSGTTLDAVPIYTATVPAIGRTGSEIEILGLNDISYWETSTRIRQLSQKLSTFISPFKSFDSFTIAVSLNDKQVELTSLEKPLRDAATCRFEYTWDDEQLDVAGDIKLNFFRTKGKEEIYDQFVAPDSGNELRLFLAAHKETSQLKIKVGKGAWFLRLKEQKRWDLLVPKGGREAKPGPFLGELFVFNFNLINARSDKAEDVLDPISGAETIVAEREMIKSLAGLFIFRDNFRIRTQDDWLRLSEAQTTGSSYYSLRPANVIGYFSVTSGDNPLLVEKSDREGFVDNREWQGFWRISNGVKGVINASIESLRRAWVDYCNQKQNTPNDFIRDPETGLKNLRNIVADAEIKEQQRKVRDTRRVSALTRAREALSGASKNHKIEGTERESVQKTLALVEELIREGQEEADANAQIYGRLIASKQAIETIGEQIRLMREQLAEVYDMVAIGLSAQGLVHELQPLLDDVNARLTSLKKRFPPDLFDDESAVSEIDHIRAVNSVLSKKIGFMDPMMRTFREQRTSINIKEFLADYFQYRKEKHSEAGIECIRPSASSSDLVIKFNKGRLTQVIDNVIRNSEYWLAKLKIKKPKINCEIRGNTLIIWDNGEGVRRRVEDSLFEIFVTDKPVGEGHGLGLFIVSRLLQSYGCSISLAQERNEYGNRYKFIIDFSGALK